MTESMTMLLGWMEMNPLMVAAAIAWSFIWKGLALWRSASLRQKPWFIVILLVNTLGILEIIYLFLIARNYKVEVVEQ